MRTYCAQEMNQAISDIKRFFEALPDQRLQIKRHEVTRSEGQQALIHTIIRKMASQTGAGEDYMKQEVLKRNSEGVFPHWPYDLQKKMNGQTALVPMSESKLTKGDESKLIEHLYALCAEWGVEL